MPRRSRLAAGWVIAAAIALPSAGCGSSGSAITVAAVAAPGAAGSAAFRLPAGAVTLHAGPGAVRARVASAGYRIRIAVSPNRATRPNRVTVALSRAGRPVPRALVHLSAGMLDMGMGVAAYRLAGSGAYAVRTPAWLMPGEWGLAFTITPPGRRPIHVVLADRLRR